MDPCGFEHFVADPWDERGYETTVSTASVDRGVDITAVRHEPYHHEELIQAKRHSEGNTVGSPAIQQYTGLKHQEHGVDTVIVVTTSSFTEQARDLAHQLNVELIDGESLCTMVEAERAESLVSEHVEPEPALDTRVDGKNEQILEDDAEPTVTVDDGDTSWTTATEEREPDVEGMGDNWHYGIGAGLGAVTLDMVLATGLFTLVDRLLLPITTYYDSKYVRANGEWHPSTPLYVAGAAIPMIWFVSASLYLYRRYAAFDDDDNEPAPLADSTEENTIATIQTQYARGELTNEEFEQRLDQALETEQLDDATSVADRDRSR